MNHLLQGVVYGSEGTGGSIASYNYRMKAYAKTGTTSDTKDAWLVGGTPYYVGSVWYGFDHNHKVSNNNMAKNIWRDVMKEIHKGLDTNIDFPESDYVTYRKYCTSSGMVATERCSSTALGWYKTSQLKPCTTHGGSVLGEVDPSVANTSSGDTSSGDGTSSNTSSNKTSSTSNSSAATSKPAVNTTSKPADTTISKPEEGNTTSNHPGADSAEPAEQQLAGE